MDDAVAELRRLACDAAKEAPDPRAKRCWLWHEWTLWQKGHPFSLFQERRCVRCGLTKARDL